MSCKSILVLEQENQSLYLVIELDNGRGAYPQSIV